MAKALFNRSVFAGAVPEAREVASKDAAKLVTRVSKETEQNIRNLITHAIDAGIPVYDAARAIRGMVGLTERQGMAVMNYRSRLIENGLPIARVDRMVQKYSDKQLKLRAQTIARTEVMGALNEGQRQSWRQAQKDKLLGPDAKREWMTTDNACPVCGPMNGRTVPLSKDFPVPGPPAHPRCRCTENLLPGKIPTQALQEASKETFQIPDRHAEGLEAAQLQLKLFGPKSQRVADITSGFRGKLTIEEQHAFRSAVAEAKKVSRVYPLEGVETYVDGGKSFEINTALRQGKMDALPQSGQVLQSIRNLDAAMKPASKDMVLYRLSNQSMLNGLKQGSVFRDAGFTSTTQTKNSLGAIQQALSKGSQNRLITIRVPKGTPMADVNAMLGKGHRYSAQNEVILARGHEFEVVSQDGRDLVVQIVGKQ